MSLFFFYCGERGCFDLVFSCGLLHKLKISKKLDVPKVAGYRVEQKWGGEKSVHMFRIKTVFQQTNCMECNVGYFLIRGHLQGLLRVGY